MGWLKKWMEEDTSEHIVGIGWGDFLIQSDDDHDVQRRPHATFEPVAALTLCILALWNGKAV